MRYKILLGYIAASSFVLFMARNGWTQTVFRVGAWCLQQNAPAPQAIYTPSPGVWRIYTHERDRLLNLGLNYFIACANLDAEQALVFMGDSLAAAPAFKDFKSTLSWSPANASSAIPY